jgi:ACS family tartrate transporter-like MFS transporter
VTGRLNLLPGTQRAVPMTTTVMPVSALDRARRRAYLRLLPLLFVCYVIAYVDRVNPGIAQLTMARDLPAFTEELLGFGTGVFFIGYFLLEIPGALCVELWSARKWIGSIMIVWGILAALTAVVAAPWHFYTIRLLLGLAQAGFFPGVTVYLTHWFPTRDRARALAYFFLAPPVAQFLSPRLSYPLLRIGTEGRPELLGLHGWQWMFIVWGLPAVLLGLVVLGTLTDRPADAAWLLPDEREALEQQLAHERKLHGGARHMTVLQALRNRRVLILAGAYLLALTGTYGVAIFMPRILQSWYTLDLNTVTWLVVLPPLGWLCGLLVIGSNSDRMQERRLHTVVPIGVGALALIVMAILGVPPRTVGVGLFTLAYFASAFLPAFWAIPSLFLTEAAAAGCIGLINSIGNLGGLLGPWILGSVKTRTGDYRLGMIILGSSMSLSAVILFTLGMGKRPEARGGSPNPEEIPAVELQRR